MVALVLSCRSASAREDDGQRDEGDRQREENDGTRRAPRRADAKRRVHAGAPIAGGVAIRARRGTIRTSTSFAAAEECQRDHGEERRRVR